MPGRVRTLSDPFALLAVAGSIAETAAVAEALVRTLEPGGVVVLTGGLGSGKTTLVKGMAHALGIDPASVRSPTFTIIHEYRGGRLPLVHMDVYRLNGPEEFDAVGGFEYLAANRGLVAIEWGELILDALDPGWLQLKIVPGEGPEGRAFWARASDGASRAWLDRIRQQLKVEGMS